MRRSLRWVSVILLAGLLTSPSILARYVEVTPREHETKETVLYVGSLYVFTAAGFTWINWDKLQQNADLNNFGKMVVFDNDLPTSNWGVHVFTGSQCYLFYRARSYSKIDSLLLTALQSALFEFTVEFLQEKASLEDLINTPLVGGLLGVGFEKASLPLLNSGVLPLKLLGHLINLPTALGLYEGQVEAAPIISTKTAGLFVKVRF